MTDFQAIFQDRSGSERIAKRLARAGLCSRRDAERWIQAGRVAVDDKVLETPAVTVDAKSRIRVDGKPIPTIEVPRLWRYHKPRGHITSTRDVRGRTTVFEDFPKDMPRVVTVGRLDVESEGLLMLTNDGELARLLELPATGWVRRYRVRVHGRPQPERLEKLKRGVIIDGVKYGPVEATIDHQAASNAWITIGLREGKNREVRRLMEYIELSVNRLIRISFGPFQLGNLEASSVEEIRQRSLKDQLGLEKTEAQATGTARAKPKPKPHARPKGVMLTRPKPGSPTDNRAVRKTSSNPNKTAGKFDTIKSGSEKFSTTKPRTTGPRATLKLEPKAPRSAVRPKTAPHKPANKTETEAGHADRRRKPARR
jgi:23S rRNA pseudouridine2605 synthase